MKFHRPMSYTACSSLDLFSSQRQQVHARNTDLYKHVAKPLLSISTTRSMDIERLAKPLKYVVEARPKERDRTSGETAGTLLLLLRTLANFRSLDEAVAAERGSRQLAT